MTVVDVQRDLLVDRGLGVRASAPPVREAAPLRIAMLAPPWISVPPPGYGGIEAVVALLTRELVRRGHDVTLFAAPGSHSEAEVHTLLAAAHPEAIERRSMRSTMSRGRSRRSSAPGATVGRTT